MAFSNVAKAAAQKLDPQGNPKTQDSGSTSAVEPGQSAAVAQPKKDEAAAANGTTKGKGRDNMEEGKMSTMKGISPELRALMSREVERMPRKEVKSKGMGFDSAGK